MNLNENTCIGCEALRHLDDVPTLAPDIIAGLKSDHQFAQHARQISMFDYSPTYSEEEIRFIGYAKETLQGEPREYGASPIPRLLEEANARKEDDEYAAGRHGLNKALATIKRTIDPEFRRLAREILVRVAKAQPFLTSDDIWQRMPEQFDLAHYGEKRHMGDITTWGKRKRYLEKSHQYVPSKSPKANMVPHNQWRSLIFEREQPTW